MSAAVVEMVGDSDVVQGLLWDVFVGLSTKRWSRGEHCRICCCIP